MNPFKSKFKRFRIPIGITLALFITFAVFQNGSCSNVTYQSRRSPQPFDVVIEPSPSPTSSPTPTLRPKMDIHFMVKKNGTLGLETIRLEQQIPKFLQRLIHDGWDFRFTINTLDEEINASYEIAASHYEPILEPLPPTLSDRIRLPSGFNGYLIPQFGEKPHFGMEGFMYVYSFVNYLPIMRKDSLLVVIVVSNGDHGYSQSDSEASMESDFKNWKNTLLWLKSYDPKQVAFYSIVSVAPETLCAPGTAIQGKRYMKMAEELGGASFDICSRNADSILNAIAADLQKKKSP